MTPSPVLFPIGKSDFQSIRVGHYHYVDKSLFIEQVIKDGAEVLLLPRPRRFGKTLNLSMLRYFLERPKEAKKSLLEERRSLFSGLQIEQSAMAFDHFAKYPVIFLTFKDVKTNSWEESVVKLKELLSELFTTHSVIQEKLAPQEQEYFHNVLFRKASVAELSSALLFLSKHLADYYQEKVVILIDEYDTCIHEAYAHGYYQEAISFFRNLLSGAFKDNSALYKGVMTGILRIARESLFSGLNNLDVYSVLNQSYASSFGFTEDEVTHLAKQVGLESLLPDLKSWYNGYLFGKQTIYNPWSVLHFLSKPEEGLKAYWVNTSSNELIKQLLFARNLPIRTEIETLLQGGSIEKPIYENTVFSDLEKPGQALWSFLLFCGYLTLDSSYQKDAELYGKLRVVNQEVLGEFRSLTRMWFEEQIGYSLSVEQLIKGLFRGDAQVVEQTLGELMKVSMSFFDAPDSAQKTKRKTKGQAGSQKQVAPKPKAAQKGDPERVYHMFVLGMMLNLSSEYDSRSNPESGYGRPDLLLIPKVEGKPGVVLEFKVADKGKTVDKAMNDALKQLDERAYETELLQRGANPVYQYAAVFSGKKVSVKLKSERKEGLAENR